MSEEELIETLRAFEKNRVEQLEKPARNLFYAIMKIADERDRLNNIIKEAQEYLRSATHLLLEYNKPFRKVGKYEEQYCKRESDLKRILKGEKVEWGIILEKEKIIYGDKLKVEWYGESILDKGE